MSGFIKKVGTTPVRGNGFIIDSFNTTDNKEFNAPSLNAVENRTDNNLLFMGDFSSKSTDTPISGNKMCGWVATPSAYATFAPGYGLTFQPANNVSRTTKVTSPRIGSVSEELETFLGYDEKLFSLSFIFRSVNIPTGGEVIPRTVGKIEGIALSNLSAKTYSYKDANDNDLFVLVPKQIGKLGGKLEFEVTIAPGYRISLEYIKFEIGASATPFSLYDKSAGAYDAIAQVEKSVSELDTRIDTIEDKIDNTAFVKTQSFQTPNFTINANMSVPYQGTVAMEGYTPIGVISLLPVYQTEGTVIINGFGIKTVDGVKKVYIDISNIASYNITLALQVTVLYQKNIG
jgi:hypothetical protein